jgi:hypothetical protein
MKMLLVILQNQLANPTNGIAFINYLKLILNNSHPSAT